MNQRKHWALVALGLTSAVGCGAADPTTSEIPGVHMAELNADATKLYLTSSDKDELVVVDAREVGADDTEVGLRERAYIVSRDSGEVDVIDLRTLEMVRSPEYPILSRIQLGAHPTHLALSRDGGLLAVMDEEEGTGAVSFVDPERDVEVKRLAGFHLPHFIRFSADGRFGYVANIGAHHLSRVDLESLEIDQHIPLDGFEGPPNVTEAPDEGGFADAQIAADGTLYAAHAATGRVLVYDTVNHQKLPEVGVGQNPWVVFAEHPFRDLPPRYLGPNFGDATVSMIDGEAREVVATLEGDSEAYGVNYSSRAPDRAFVMNRTLEEIAVVDTAESQILSRIPVGGNTETAATTADGRYIVAAVSGANRVVVIDADTEEIVKTFDGVGNYPWSVTIPGGQNYCH